MNALANVARAASLLCLAWIGSLSAAEVCDPELLAVGDSGTAYRQREERCEGAHKLKVSSSSKLAVASFTRSFDLDPEMHRRLEVRWPRVEGLDTIRLRARSLGDIGRGVYYRMDSELPAGNGVMLWPSAVLAALQLERLDVGVLGWGRRELPSAGSTSIYLPLSVAPDGGAAASERDVLRLVVVPSERLEEIYLSVVDPEQPQAVIERHALAYGYYPARMPTVIEFPAPPRAGFYRLEIDASLYRDRDRLATEHLWFYSD
ncbi:MAG: hypothetical protein AAGN46_07710 [Acidobacteriota bacterium]